MFRTFLLRIPRKPVVIIETENDDADDDVIDPLSATQAGGKSFLDSFEDVENLETTIISPEEAWAAGTET